jgi:hypothetical protein
MSIGSASSRHDSIELGDDCEMTHMPHALLSGYEGAAIARISRQHYVYMGSVDVQNGALQLQFGDGRTLLLDSGSDWGSLTIMTAPWVDPFLPPEEQSEENEEFVARSGKWTEFEITEETTPPLEPDLRPFLGAVILSIRPRLDEDGRVTGAQLNTAAGQIRAEVEADELKVRAVWVLAKPDD